MKELMGKLKEVYEGSQKKVENLAEQIQADKASSGAIEKEYQHFILSGNDEEADKLFSKLNHLKNEIQKNEAKYKVLNSGQSPYELVKMVDEIKDTGDKEIERLKEQRTKKHEEIEQLRELYFAKIEELGAISKEMKNIQTEVRRAERHIDPSMPSFTAPFYAEQNEVHKFKIDNQGLIFQAWQGTRQKGVTR